MARLRIGQAAELVRVSPDPVRRLVDAGELKTVRSAGGQRLIDGAALARYMAAQAKTEPPEMIRESARNRFPGIVTRVVRDTVMAQVEMQAGRHRGVSLISRESADALRPQPGGVAVASIQSTHVTIQLPPRCCGSR